MIYLILEGDFNFMAEPTGQKNKKIKVNNIFWLIFNMNLYIIQGFLYHLVIET